MSPTIKKGAASPRRLLPHSIGFTLIATAILFTLTFSLRHAWAKQLPADDLTAHEWGTFTSISGPDGRPMDWLTLSASTNLPSFIEHFRNVKFKGGLRGTVRMETPVLYFYSPRETTVSVNVSFSRGLITEWYPHADSVNPTLTTRDFSLYNLKAPGAISWNSVHIDPSAAPDFPSDKSENPYYAARQTSSAPLSVERSSEQRSEKFLFYRGVAAFAPPLSATLYSDDTVHLRNVSAEPISDVILFERRGEKLGYRVLGPLRDEASLPMPTLGGSLDSLTSHLEGVLISQGLYPDEAHAMLETWKTSWFEEGARLIYIVPRTFVDSVLPLNIKPAPTKTVRVFLARLELITPATQQALESAFTTGDSATLAKYSRFLDPILEYMLQQSTDEARQQRLLSYLNSMPIDAR